MPLNVTLASSLLNVELEQDDAIAAAGGRVFTTGISALDNELPGDLWRGGDVIGVSTGTGAMSETKLALEVVATHLIEQGQRGSDALVEGAESELKMSESVGVSVFIIAPPELATSSIRRLYQLLTSRLQHSQSKPELGPASNAPRAQHLLDPRNCLAAVSLLQYLDIAGLTESLAEVSTALSLDRPEAESRRQGRRILLVQGLSGCISLTQRRSGLVQTAALLGSVLGGIRGVVRRDAGCLGLVEVDVLWSSLATGTSGAAASPAVGADSRLMTLDTAFASRTGRVLRVNLNSTLARIVEDGVDVLVVVHDGDGKIDGRGDGGKIVEVGGDERADCCGDGSAVGGWAVWS